MARRPQQLIRPLVGGLLAAATGAALADAADDALVFRAITRRTAEAALSSKRAIDALGGGEGRGALEVSPWWRGAVSAPLWGRRQGGGFPRSGGSVASASFTVTGPPESGSRAADVVVMAVAAREEEKREREKEEEEKEVASTSSSTSSSSSSTSSPPRSLSALLRSFSRRWSPEGWTLVSADITLPRPGGLPGPATGVSLMEEVEKLSLSREREDEEAKNKKK